MQTAIGVPGRHAQRDVLDLFRSLQWDPAYDYKAERSRS